MLNGAKRCQTGGIAGSGGIPAILERGEVVLRHDQVKSLGGSPVVINQNITFVINAIDAQGVDEILQRSKGSIIRVIKDAVERQPNLLRR